MSSKQFGNHVDSRAASNELAKGEFMSSSELSSVRNGPFDPKYELLSGLR